MRFSPAQVVGTSRYLVKMRDDLVQRSGNGLFIHAQVKNRRFPELGTSGLWFVGSVALALAVGFSLPFLYEHSLELYAALIVAILAAAILQMPRVRAYDDRLGWVLFVIVLCLFGIYPQYISLQISGLPWISPMRLVMAVLLFVWLHACRTSPDMMDRIAACIRGNRPFFILLAVFVVCQLLAIPTSRDPGQAAQKFLLFQLYWTFPFFLIISVARTPERLSLLALLFIIFAAAQCLVGFLEARQERLIWLDYLPPGFGADSEVLTRIIQGTFRAEGYRVQGSFTVSLVYAEFLAVLLPFALFAFVDGRNVFLRGFGLAVAIAILPAQYLSGSRLGMVGSITVFLSIIALFVVRIWRTNKQSMIGPFLLLLLPFGFAAFALAFASSPRLRALTIGGGEHQASTDSRFEMWTMGLPRILERPLFGHGPGLGAETLGFTNLAGVLTIDTYWLSALLEFGIIGFAALFGMIGYGIYMGARSYVERRSSLAWLGGPISVALLVFAIIKLVLSQTDNHMLIFLLLGLAVLIYGAEPAMASRAAGNEHAPPASAHAVALTKASSKPVRLPAPTRPALAPSRQIARIARPGEAGQSTPTNRRRKS